MLVIAQVGQSDQQHTACQEIWWFLVSREGTSVRKGLALMCLSEVL
jgi:hypothetical protein